MEHENKQDEEKLNQGSESADEIKDVIRKLEYELQSKTTELRLLQEKLKNNSPKPENGEKVLRYEILHEVNGLINKRFLTAATIVTLLLAVFSFLGYENIKNSLLNKIDINELKEKVLIAAENEIKEVKNTFNELNNK